MSEEEEKGGGAKDEKSDPSFPSGSLLSHHSFIIMKIQHIKTLSLKSLQTGAKMVIPFILPIHHEI